MKRLLLLTVLIAVATRLYADDVVIAPPANAGGDEPSLAAPVQTEFVSSRRGARSPSHDDVRFQFAADETAAAEGGAGTQASSASDFHCVCDCDCDIDRLDCWCTCETACCTTDEWCQHPCQCSHGTMRLLEDGCWVSDDKFCDVSGPPDSDYDGAIRFGWWGVGANGSPTRVGEYQSLRSSPFFDVDTVINDGTRSLDLTMSGLDDEANDVSALYYGPNLSADIDYQRFLRRWDHDPMAAPDIGPPIPPQNPNDVISEDLNVGEDYAIRVHQLDAQFKGRITDNMSWRMNVWSMRKFGERQANSVGHCYDMDGAVGSQDNRCHVLSQRQNIDWTTFELQPVLEARFGRVTLEGSYTMRTFGQDDQLVTRDYTRFGYQGPGGSGTYGEQFLNNVVPESMTNIGRLKIGAAINDNNQFYGNLYIGETENHFRNTKRQLGGFDLRLTNRTFDRLTLTPYGSQYDENNQLPTRLFSAAPYGLGETTDGADPTVTHPIDYTRTRVGMKGDWRPFDDEGPYDPDEWDVWSTLRLTPGYEYQHLKRQFATYSSTRLGEFTQPDTKTHMVELGPNWKWSPALSNYVRYRAYFTEDPLIGVRESQGRFNTNLPEQRHGVEFGGSWNPTYNFMVNAQFSVINSWNHSFYPSNAVDNRPIRFSEDDYPYIISLWYAPTERWSLSAAYANFTNFIDQDITVGFRGPETGGSPFETTPWSYQGENSLVSLSSTYAWSPTVNLLGGVEWNGGSNYFDAPPMDDAIVLGPPVSLNGPGDWSTLPLYSALRVETWRVTAGIDWQPRRHFTLYTRYVYFDWNDLSQGTYTGDAHMVLAGGSLLY